MKGLREVVECYDMLYQEDPHTLLTRRVGVGSSAETMYLKKIYWVSISGLEVRAVTKS